MACVVIDERLTRAAVQALTDERTFARGAEYCQLGQVLWLAEAPNGYCAVVQGQRAYRVSLQVTSEGIQPHCDCPAATATDWCKHAVAVALTALNAPPRVSLTEITNHLNQLSQTDLVALSSQAATRDEDLRERLWLQLPTASAEVLPDDYRRAVDLALSQARWTGNCDEVILTLQKLVERLTETGNTAMAVALLDYALKQVPAGFPIEEWRNLREWITRRLEVLP